MDGHGTYTRRSKVTGTPLTLGSADVWNCFDQIQMAFLCLLLRLSGFPTGPLTAYTSFHQQCLYYNTLAGGLGLPHYHPCSIPQGCPFSMTQLAFLLAPWTQQIRALRAIPGSLADDLMVIALGEDHEQIFKSAYSATISYLHAIGAKVTSKKCFTFSTEPSTREELRDHYWTHLCARISTATSFRDLGGHLNVGRTMSAATLTARIHLAIAMCIRLAAMPWDRRTKIHITLTIILPKAFYGCEVAAPAEKPLEELSRAIARTIGCYNASSSNLLTFHLSTHHMLQPGSYIMLRRAQLMRRIIAKHPWAEGKVKSILQQYEQQAVMGICSGPLQDEPPTCPPLIWRPIFMDYPGPIHGRTSGALLHLPGRAQGCHHH